MMTWKGHIFINQALFSTLFTSGEGQIDKYNLPRQQSKWYWNTRLLEYWFFYKIFFHNVTKSIMKVMNLQMMKIHYKTEHENNN